MGTTSAHNAGPYFDPAGFDKSSDGAESKNLRAVELTHGRVAMTACSSLLSPQHFKGKQNETRGDIAGIAGAGLIAANFPERADAFVYNGTEYFDVFFGIDPW